MGLINRLRYIFRTGDGPVVTISIIALTVVIWLAQIITANAVTIALVFQPYYAIFEPWRYLTSAFLHSTSPLFGDIPIPTPLHIGMNMYVLYVIGPVLEYHLGRLKFIALYLLSALGGNIAVSVYACFIDSTLWGVPSLGASGAIFGLFTAMIMLQRRLGLDLKGIMMTLLINVAIPFILPGIAGQAHIGGGIIGLVLGYAYYFLPNRFMDVDRKNVHIISTIAVFVLLIALALIPPFVNPFGSL
jgi:membrane associated rhomboid family serine protease